jgi:hypothetical protein
MFRTTIAAALLALSSTTAFAEVTTINSIRVTADITAIENPQAAEYWGSLTTDLEAAILARLVDRIAEDGAQIKIDLNEIALSNTFQNAFGLEDAVLVGQVTISHETDNSQFNAYELTITANASGVLSEDGTILAGAFADTPEYYAAFISAFADGVVDRLN